MKSKPPVKKSYGEVKGRIELNPKGFGFVVPEEPDKGKDVMIRQSNLNGAMNGDTVLAQVTRVRGDQRQGQIEEILARHPSNHQVIGTYHKSDESTFVQAEDKNFLYPIVIGRGMAGGAKDGQKVVAMIRKFPTGDQPPFGEIVTVLGYPDDTSIDFKKICYKYGLSQTFPEEVEAELEALRSYEITDGDREDRTDCRDLYTVTIDPADAKDHDDGVSVRLLDNGCYELLVHIADVSHFVRPGTALDTEGFRRGNSYYLIDRVIPMLPALLSNKLCSLNEDEDSLGMSVRIVFDKSGEIQSEEFMKSIIRIDDNISYDDAEKARVDTGHAYHGIYQIMSDLADILHSERRKHGCIDFDFPEMKIILDENDEVEKIVKVERLKTYSIIEEFMLAANMSVARLLEKSGRLMVYRIHEHPNHEKLEKFIGAVQAFGPGIDTRDRTDPKTLQKILTSFKGHPEEKLVNILLLRSLQEAKYSTENKGHFGLAVDSYTHFTSPIRRYPDLAVHRILKTQLGGKSDRQPARGDLAETCAHCSQTERRADMAEREFQEIKKIRHLTKYIGHVFPAVVSGVQHYGLFIELTDFGIDGLLRTESLGGEDLFYNRDLLQLKGRKTGVIYKMGMPMDVQLAKVDIDTQQIDLILPDRRN
jgi:ribonuclease R